jgi:hypothetical protein
MARNLDISANNTLFAFVNHLAIAVPLIGMALEFVSRFQRCAVENENSSAAFTLIAW